MAEHVTIAVMDKPSKQPVDINLDLGIQNILPWSHGLSITAVHVQPAMYDSRLVFLQRGLETGALTCVALRQSVEHG